MIRGLIFDMDGVLLDTEKIYFQCWQESAAELGFSIPPEAALAVRSCCQKFAEPFLKHILGEKFDYVTARDRRRELVSTYIANNGIKPKPCVMKLLRYCNEHKISVAVATATSKRLALERLQLAGMHELFTNIVGGDEVKCGKPAPDIYRIATKALMLYPEECIAVEDSPNGIISAFAAGCKPVMVPDLTQPDMTIQPILYGIANTLEDIIPILKKESEKFGEMA